MLLLSACAKPSDQTPAAKITVGEVVVRWSLRVTKDDPVETFDRHLSCCSLPYVAFIYDGVENVPGYEALADDEMARVKKLASETPKIIEGTEPRHLLAFVWLLILCLSQAQRKRRARLLHRSVSRTTTMMCWLLPSHHRRRSKRSEHI